MNTTEIRCGECGGTFHGTWAAVECRKCGKVLDPTRDFQPDADEVIRLSPTGTLLAVRTV